MGSLFIKDEAVNDLAAEAMKVLGVASKTEAVRIALEAVIRNGRQQRSLSEKLQQAQLLADQIGPVDSEHDAKADMDELWGER